MHGFCKWWLFKNFLRIYLNKNVLDSKGLLDLYILFLELGKSFVVKLNLFCAGCAGSKNIKRYCF